MKFSKKYLAIIGGIVLVILVAGVSVRAAEESADQRRAIKRKKLAQAHISREVRSKEMLETIRTVRTIEALKLDEEQIAQFLPKQRRMRELKEKYLKTRKEKVEELAKLLESKASSRVLEKALAELKGAKEKFRAASKALGDEIDSILTPEQRARLVIFKRDFRKEMRRMLKKPSERARSLEKRRGTKSQRERSPRGSERGK